VVKVWKNPQSLLFEEIQQPVAMAGGCGKINT